MVKKMIEKNQECGWQFIFLGANMDAVSEAEKIGIKRTHAASYKNDKKGVALNYAVAGNVIDCMIRCDLSSADKELAIPKMLRPVSDYLEDEN